MSARSFFDTNVLICADDKAAPAKQRKAVNLVTEHLRAGTGVLSMQVLQEYFVKVTRKLRVDTSIARRKVELLAEFDVAAPEVADILAAIDLHRLPGFSFWDALILLSAKQAGCSVLYSEDMQGAREVDGVRIVNPFLWESGPQRLKPSLNSRLKRHEWKLVFFPVVFGTENSRSLDSGATFKGERLTSARDDNAWERETENASYLAALATFTLFALAA